MRYVLAGVIAAVLALVADLAPLRAGVESPPFSLQSPGTLPGLSDNTSFFAGFGAGGTLLMTSGAPFYTTVIGAGAGAALPNNVGGTSNTLVGHNAGYLYTGTSGGNHALTAMGDSAGGSVTTGADNDFFGAQAGNNDDANGFITGSSNNGFGVHSLGHLSSGAQNVAVGGYSMVGCGTYSSPGCPLLTGSANSGMGDHTLANIQGAATLNTASGASAGLNLTTGSQNTFDGAFSGTEVTTGGTNIEVGYNRHDLVATGNNQISIGGVFKYLGDQGEHEVDLIDTNSSSYIAKFLGGYGANTSYLIAQGGGGAQLQLYNANAGGYTQVNPQVTPVSTKAASYNVALSDSGSCLNNNGASGEVDFTLPAATVGERHCFVVMAAQPLKVIAPSGSHIAIDTSNSASGGNITTSSTFASVEITAITSTQWVATAVSNKSSWTVN